MKRGFILIEFITAIAIIMILAAILFPVFARAREKARQSDCLNNLLNVGIALRHYAADYNGWYPPQDNELSPLFASHLPDRHVLDCLSYTGTGEWTSGDYSYRAGYCDDDRFDLIVMVERRLNLHNSGCNYLSVDGHAKWVNTTGSGSPPETLRQEILTMPGLDPICANMSMWPTVPTSLEGPAERRRVVCGVTRLVRGRHAARGWRDDREGHARAGLRRAQTTARSLGRPLQRTTSAYPRAYRAGPRGSVKRGG